MKKALSYILCVVMLLAMLPLTVFATDTAFELTVDTSNCATAKQGDTVTVPVLVTANSGVNFIKAKLSYDSAVFDLVSIDGNADFIMGDYTIKNTVIGWETDDEQYPEQNNEQNNILFCTITFNVKADAAIDDSIISFSEILCSNADYDDFDGTVVPGTIRITRPISGAAFVNGNNQTLFEEDVRNEALGTWEGELANPGEGYVFAGWFSGLSKEYKSADGFYVIPDTIETAVAGSELRPRYEDAVEGETYNALWIADTGANVLAIGEDSFRVFHADDDYDALNAAINGFKEGERLKLVEDMFCKTVEYVNANTNNLHWDLNGCSVTASTSKGYYVLSMKSNSNNVNITVDSSRGQGTLSAKGNYAAFGYTEGSSFFIKDIKLNNANVLSLTSGTITNCEIKNTNGNQVALKVKNAGGSVTIVGGKISAAGALIQANNSTVKITNCTMESFGSNKQLFTGKNNSLPGSTLPPSGTLILGEGNKLTADYCTTLCANFADVQFTSLTDEYQLSTATTDPFTNVTTVIIPDNKEYGVVNGLLMFGSTYTVTYHDEFGNAINSYSAKVMEGGYADLSKTANYTDNRYKWGGWALEPGSKTALTTLVVKGNTNLYPVRVERGVIDNYGQEIIDPTKNIVSQYYVNDETSNVEAVLKNAHKLSDLPSLTIRETWFYVDKETNPKDPETKKMGITELVFTAEALDSIASCFSIENEYNDVKFNIKRTSPVAGDNFVGKVELSATKDSEILNFAGNVELKVSFETENGKSYCAYYIDENGVAHPLATSLTNDGQYNYAVFTANGYGTFEIREAPVAQVGEHVFNTMDAALEAAKDMENATITLLADVSGTINVSQVVTILSNGFSATFKDTGDYDLVTEENGWQVVACEFTQESTLFLATEANCSAAATYYYKCVRCYGHGTETFSYGEPDPDKHQMDEDKGNCELCLMATKTCLDSYSISLNGDIGVNFYVNVTDADLANAKMVIQVAQQDPYEIALADAEHDGDQYKVSIDVAARQMTDEICVKVLVGDTIKDSCKTSVKAYAMGLLGETAPENYTGLQKLAVAMLNYGAWAQKHFGYNTANLANAGLSEADQNAISTVTADTLSTFAFQGNDGKAKLTSASLILKSETTLRLFFTVDGELNVVHNNEPLTANTRGGYSYVDITNIDAKSLSKDVTVTANNNDVTCSPMAYGYAVLKANDNSVLCDLVRALYLYNQAAVAYFTN